MAEKPTDCGYTKVEIPTENPSVTPADRPRKGNPPTDPEKVQNLGPRVKKLSK